MKKYFLFFNLLFLFCMGLPQTALAKRKYRHIKREHGLKFSWQAPTLSFRSDRMEMSFDLEGAYSYNWMGMLELGPYFSLYGGTDSTGNLVSQRHSAGLLIEYNIIKNRGKRKWIPAIGLKAGASQDIKYGQDILFSTGLHGALKVFVGKRTPFTVTLGYRLLTPFGAFFQTMYHNMDVSMGFSYYFDFY